MQNEIDSIRQYCKSYIAESAGLPLYRSLNKAGNDIRRIKVRHRKAPDANLDSCFQGVIGQEYPNLLGRTVFTYPRPIAESENYESFFIFAPDGFRYLYNTVIRDSVAEYSFLFDRLTEHFDEIGEAKSAIMDSIDLGYKQDDLAVGIACGAEILIYDISHYYAVRSSLFDYQDLLHLINQ